MPYGKPNGFSKRKKHQSTDQVDFEETAAQEAPQSMQPARLTSSERYGLFARLAWLTCYKALFAAEMAADAELMSELAVQFASTYMRRAVASDPEAHRPLRTSTACGRRAAFCDVRPTSRTCRSRRPRALWLLRVGLAPGARAAHGMVERGRLGALYGEVQGVAMP